jgi:hypothetical protein
VHITRRTALGLAAGGLAAMVVPEATRAKATNPPGPPPEYFDFNILFDGNVVGAHRIGVELAGDETLVRTDIEIVVKIAFITVFNYAHSGEERWRNDRLVSLRSSTVQDGDKLEVDGEATANGFRVVSDQGPYTAPANSWTSNNLWDRKVLAHTALIDAQHGGEVGLSAKSLGQDSVEVAGQKLAATRHQIITPYLAGNLWYDGANRLVKATFDCRGETIVYALRA